MNYWLVKSEGDCYSIDDFKKDGRTAWTGIRNFQARNYMRDGMKVGDLVLFHHSNGTTKNPTGIYGIAKVVSDPHIDKTALDPKDEHFDPKAVKYEREGKEPLWMCVDMEFVKKFERPVTLAEIKKDKTLNKMLVAKRGVRLSVLPVDALHFELIKKLGMAVK
ncbi:MAG: EVE domain-containing protein [Patescibacteria group bacterium]